MPCHSLSEHNLYEACFLALAYERKEAIMEDYDITCDDCGISFSRMTKLAEYVVNAHTWEFEKTNEFCPSCAHSEEARRTYGEVEEWALKGFVECMDREYGEPLEVKWLQGDEHKWLFHVRRIACSERTLDEENR